MFSKAPDDRIDELTRVRKKVLYLGCVPRKEIMHVESNIIVTLNLLELNEIFSNVLKIQSSCEMLLLFSRQIKSSQILLKCSQIIPNPLECSQIWVNKIASFQMQSFFNLKKCSFCLSQIKSDFRSIFLKCSQTFLNDLKFESSPLSQSKSYLFKCDPFLILFFKCLFCLSQIKSQIFSNLFI